MTSKKYQIKGHVVNCQSRLGVAGLRIETWDKDLIFNDLLGSAQTDASGYFRIEFTEEYYKECFLDQQPDLFFKIFQKGELVSSTEKSVLWNFDIAKTDIIIEVDIPGTVADTGTGNGNNDNTNRQVKGRVFSHEMRGLSGLRVILVDKNVGQEVRRLGESISGELGEYELNYSVENLNKLKPDVQVQVIDESEAILALSEVRYNAASIEKGLNIVIPVENFSFPTEYRRLVNELAAQLGKSEQDQINKCLAELKEDDQQQDITYLANKTGWDARMVAMVALANQFAERNKIAPEFYYALFRSGAPTNQVALDQLAPETVKQAWVSAIEQGILPNEFEAKIPPALEQFKALSRTRLLDAPAITGVSSFKELIENTLANTADQQRFAELYYEQRDDLEGFWQTVYIEFPKEAERLQFNGKLSFLTTNNAPLIQRLHTKHVNLQTPLDLVRKGLYQPQNWEEMLTDDMPIPDYIQGEDLAERKANYAAVMANQLSLSYPTAVVAERIRINVIPVGTDVAIKNQVTTFLDEQQGLFELGSHPVEQFLQQHNISLDLAALTEIKKLQRVYQISLSDAAMGKLLARNIDSAYAVVRYDEARFVSAFKDDLGGANEAKLTYAKAHLVHNSVLNLSTAFFLEKSAISTYTIDNNAVLKQANMQMNAAMPISSTLEEILGEMDYCSCEHCRSWLSPAAYLVDLLQFLGDATSTSPSPLDTLLHQRPDIAHLQLTCENTNTILPYIDLVNEVLEHFVVHDGSLTTFEGHNIKEGARSEELLANPQFVEDSAYQRLTGRPVEDGSVGALLPPTTPLPFHYALESFRLYFDHFEIPLHEVMERLRINDSLERTGEDTDTNTNYGWYDILMERLKISRPEYRILTDSSTPLQRLYGEKADDEDSGYTIEELISQLDSIDLSEQDGTTRQYSFGMGNAKLFTRKFDISYEDLISITRTQFINPNSYLIPKLEKLRVDFTTLQAILNGTIDIVTVNAIPIDDLDMSQYGGNSEQSEDDKYVQLLQWLNENKPKIETLIVLIDVGSNEDVCSFDTTEMRHVENEPDLPAHLSAIEFLKLLRFIRLWHKLGWSIEQTDSAIVSLYPDIQHSDLEAGYTEEAALLDEKFQLLLVRLAHFQQVMQQLKLSPKRDLIPLLACWSVIDTSAEYSLYQQMFLSPTSLHLDDIFNKDEYGNYPGSLANGGKIWDHAEALQAAFNLNHDEFALIYKALDFADNEPLVPSGSLDKARLNNISAIYRYAYLARKLRLSVQEFIALKDMSGFDPFLPLDLDADDESEQPFGALRPPTIHFLELVQSIKDSPFTVSQLQYLIQHIELNDDTAQFQQDMLGFARTLRIDLLRIDRELALSDIGDPNGELIKAKMALVYDTEATDVFFGLLNNTTSFSVEYSHDDEQLDDSIIAVTKRIHYDHFQKQLSFAGRMTVIEQNALEAITPASSTFNAAIQALFEQGQQAYSLFFEQYPELHEPYETFVNSAAPIEAKLTALLAGFLPELRNRLMKQLIQHKTSTQLGADLALVIALLEQHELLHAEISPEPAIDDFLILQEKGLSAEIFFADDVDGEPDHNRTVDTIAYQEGEFEAPSGTASLIVSGIWKGFIEVPDNGLYNFYIETNNEGTEVELFLDEVQVINNLSRYNVIPVELQAGNLYSFSFVAKKIETRLHLRWQRKGMARELIPATQLYPLSAINRFRATYIRLLKIIAITNSLALSSTELEYFATHADSSEQSWLNSLPVEVTPAGIMSKALLSNILALMQYNELKELMQIPEQKLIELFKNPLAEDDNGDTLISQYPEIVVVQEKMENINLQQPSSFSRAYHVSAVAKKMGLGVATLLDITSNEPNANYLRQLQGAIRARYDDTPGNSHWLKLIQPINDKLRALRRDALVPYVLHQLSQGEDTKSINTADKLFEFFLIDVQMDSCMKTSRIKQAISSVQLFVQRCLLNLNPAVKSSAINAKQWELMKHYRVWEANRKVFLWPENWLEPELRDNKSPFFKDLESELLQGDITKDAAANAFVHYLEKLDEVAKLEICGMYSEENANKIHVIARTAGAQKSYFYRRQESTGSWTAWEKINLNIEDNPILPVVWKGRLFLFWVGVQQDLPEGEDPSDDVVDFSIASQRQMKSLAGEAKTRVSVTLYWSEYYHDKWQAVRTSDVNNPLEIGVFQPNEFDRTKIELFSMIGNSDELTVSVKYPGKMEKSFKLFNMHSLPISGGENEGDKTSIRRKQIGIGQNPDNSYLGHYYQNEEFEFHRIVTVLNNTKQYGYIESHHTVSNAFEAPFFFQDHQHVFFVNSTTEQVLIGGHLLAPLDLPEHLPLDFELPPVQIWPELGGPPKEVFGIPDRSQLGTGIPNYLSTNSNIVSILQTGMVLPYGDQIVGPYGSTKNSLSIDPRAQKVLAKKTRGE